MPTLDEIKTALQRKEIVTLSSKMTHIGAYGAPVIALVGCAVFWSELLKSTRVDAIQMAIGGLLLIILGFSIYQLLVMSTATLEGKKVRLRKVLGKSYTFELKDIEKASSFALKNTRYTLLKFTDTDQKQQKVLLINSRSLLFGSEPSAKEIITLAQELYATQ